VGNNSLKISGAGASSCIEAEEGSYVGVIGQSGVSQCDAGRFANITGMSACTPCPQGKFSKKSINDTTGTHHRTPATSIII
jgi:hypothetical protein